MTMFCFSSNQVDSVDTIHRLPTMMRLSSVVLLVFPAALGFVPLQSVTVRTFSRRCQTPTDDDEDPAFKYYDKRENETIVTQEMLWRDLLEDPKVRKKNKKGSYRTLDNRDSLPFVVKVVTPDPYTPASEKKKEARKNTELERKKKKTAKQTNLMGGISASIYAEDNDGSLQKILGEFSLDKNTNCGDLLEVGDKEYEVQKARCQYKYAGGKRFIMVRKILEVKEVIRVAEENFLKRQLRKSDSLSDEPPLLE